MMSTPKHLAALGAAAIMTACVGAAIFAIGGFALTNKAGVQPQNSVAQASNVSNGSTAQQPDVQQLQALVAQYQAREQQYQAREQQYQQALSQAQAQVQQAAQQIQQFQMLLLAMQQRGLITISGGKIFLSGGD
ncbi:MAG TPA: hypothetical protein VIU38_02675 [Anaerolineales bacterium]